MSLEMLEKFLCRHNICVDLGKETREKYMNRVFNKRQNIILQSEQKKSRKNFIIGFFYIKKHMV